MTYTGDDGQQHPISTEYVAIKAQSIKNFAGVPYCHYWYQSVTGYSKIYEMASDGPDVNNDCTVDNIAYRNLVAKQTVVSVDGVPGNSGATLTPMTVIDNKIYGTVLGLPVSVKLSGGYSLTGIMSICAGTGFGLSDCSKNNREFEVLALDAQRLGNTGTRVENWSWLGNTQYAGVPGHPALTTRGFGGGTTLDIGFHEVKLKDPAGKYLTDWSFVAADAEATARNEGMAFQLNKESSGWRFVPNYMDDWIAARPTSTNPGHTALNLVDRNYRHDALMGASCKRGFDQAIAGHYSGPNYREYDNLYGLLRPQGDTVFQWTCEGPLGSQPENKGGAPMLQASPITASAGINTDTLYRSILLSNGYIDGTSTGSVAYAVQTADITVNVKVDGTVANRDKDAAQPTFTVGVKRNSDAEIPLKFTEDGGSQTLHLPVNWQGASVQLFDHGPEEYATAYKRQWVCTKDDPFNILQLSGAELQRYKATKANDYRREIYRGTVAPTGTQLRDAVLESVKTRYLREHPGDFSRSAWQLLRATQSIDCTVTYTPNTNLTLTAKIENQYGGTDTKVADDFILTATEASSDTPFTFNVDDETKHVPPATYLIGAKLRNETGTLGADVSTQGYEVTGAVCTDTAKDRDGNSTSTSNLTLTPENMRLLLDADHDIRCEVTIKQRPGELTWRKQDGDGHALGGAEFTISLNDPAQADQPTTTIVVADNIGQSGYQGPDVDPAPGVFRVTEATIDGHVVGTGLPWGSGKLIETKAPLGYVLNETPREFTISGTALITNFIDPFINAPLKLPDLPNTGAFAGPWTPILGGTVLTGLAAAWFALRRRRIAVLE